MYEPCTAWHKNLSILERRPYNTSSRRDILCKAAIPCLAHASCKALLPECSNLHLTRHLKTLQGTVPAQLGALTHLQLLNLSSNQLTGSLPALLGQLQADSGLWLGHNQFTGSIPLAWCNASVTSAVHVDYNEGLVGEVPLCLEGRLQQGRGLVGTGLTAANSPGGGPGSEQVMLISGASSSSFTTSSSSTSSSTSSSRQDAVLCNPAACGSVLLFSQCCVLPQAPSLCLALLSFACTHDPLCSRFDRTAVHWCAASIGTNS